MARVTLSLPADMLGQLDEIASNEGLTRSDVIREASAAYLTLREREHSARERVVAVRRGLNYLDSIAQMPANDSRPTLDVLRDLRGTDRDSAASARSPREGTK